MDKYRRGNHGNRGQEKSLKKYNRLEYFHFWFINGAVASDFC